MACLPHTSQDPPPVRHIWSLKACPVLATRPALFAAPHRYKSFNSHQHSTKEATLPHPLHLLLRPLPCTPTPISNDEETAAQRGLKKCKGHTAMEEEAQRFGPRQCESSLWLSVAGHWSSCIGSGKVLLVNNMPTLNTHWYLNISLANWKKALGGAARHCAYSEGVPVNRNVYEAGEQ